jgi:membrane-associated phospholipid phosphatase
VPRRARTAFAGAALGGCLVVLTAVVALHVGLGQHVDQVIFRGFLGLSRPRVNSVAGFVARLCNPTPWVYFAAAPVIVALARRRPRVALAVVMILVGANLTTQLLKPLLAVSRAHNLLGDQRPVSAASWPSGHATAAMSLALGAVLAAPGRWRGGVAALGATFAVAVSYSFLTLGWHYPSDVLGGFLIAGSWALAAVGVLFKLEALRPRLAAASPVTQVSLRRTVTPSALALAGGIALAALVALAWPHQVAGYVRSHEAFVVGAAGIALLGLLVATAVSSAFRR